MPFYKELSKSDTLHFLKSVEFECLLPANCIAISEEEANSITEKNKAKFKPTQVSARQFRWAISRLNLRDIIETAVSSSSTDLKDWYEYELIINRDDVPLTELAATLNFSEQQLDEIFKLGSTL